MAYEYNPESSRFEVPNPHRVENVFLGLAAAVCIVVALAALVRGRVLYPVQAWAGVEKCLIVAVLLLVAGIGFGVTAMRQLRIFFGRGQPAGLAEELGAEDQGVSKGAAELRATIRQNAVNYPVPEGALNNVLYSLFRDLVFSPRITQALAQGLFHTGVGLVFLLACFLVSLVGISNGAAVACIGLLYFAFAIVLVLRPLRQGRVDAPGISMKLAVVFIVGAIVGPVILAGAVPPDRYPFYGRVPFVEVTLFVLISAGIAIALLLRAVLAQTVRPTTIAAAPHLETPSFNATPAQLFTELAREMQRLWEQQIPNRSYIRVMPQVGGGQGAFEAHLLEETQPLPQDLEPLSFARAWSLDTCRWLVVLDAAATLLVLIGAVLLYQSILSAGNYGALVMGGAALIVARFAFRAGNMIWRRFEFKSRVYWVEASGNYTAASAEVGAAWRDSVRTTRQVVNVENMTLRVWVAEVDSVCFNTEGVRSGNAERSIVSMRGLPDEAQRLCRHLSEFGQSLASVVAPMSSTDHQRLAMVGALNRNARAPSASAAQAPLAGQGGSSASLPGAAPAGDAPSAPGGARFCTQCGKASESTALFCAACGARLAGAG